MLLANVGSNLERVSHALIVLYSFSVCQSDSFSLSTFSHQILSNAILRIAISVIIVKSNALCVCLLLVVVFVVSFVVSSTSYNVVVLFGVSVGFLFLVYMLFTGWLVVAIGFVVLLLLLFDFLLLVFQRVTRCFGRFCLFCLRIIRCHLISCLMMMFWSGHHILYRIWNYWWGK